MDTTDSSGSSSSRRWPVRRPSAFSRGSGPRPTAGSLAFVLICGALLLPSSGAAPPDPLVELRSYLRIDTSNPPGNEAAAAAWFRTLFETHGIEAEVLETSPGRACVLARLNAARPAAAPAASPARRALLLFNHMDVVQADAARWSVPPFSAEVKDGFLYGRGTLDMKTTGLLQALVLIRLKDEAVPLSRDVIFLGTPDEEAGNEGMRWIIGHRPELLAQVEAALTEGDTIRVEKGTVQAWGVDVAEKVTAWLKLTAHGRAGHGSVPPGDANPVVRLVRALDRISRHETPVKVSASVAAYYAALADRFPGLPASKLRSLESSLREDSRFRHDFLAVPGLAATVRNTISITMLQGGPQTNVIPSTATAHLDCRLLPGESPREFAEEIRRVAADPNITVEPLTDEQPASESGTGTALFRAIVSAAARFDPAAPVVPSLLTSWTESSLLRPLGIHSYGFEPYALDESEVSRSHGDDERISIDNVTRGYEILFAIVREAATR